MTVEFNPSVAWTEQGRAFDALFRSIQQQTGKLVPPRQACSLAAIREVAPYFRLLEIKPPQMALVRILGTAILNRTRLEITGTNLLDTFVPHARAQSWELYQRLLAVPCGSILRFKEEYTHTVLIEVVSFPLADADGEARFLASTLAEVDRNDLLLRGDGVIQGRELVGFKLIDIGAGTGA